jgi:hypothetical protein
MRSLQRLYETTAQLEIEIAKVVAKLKEKYPHADFSSQDAGVLALYLCKLLGMGSVSIVADEHGQALHVLYSLADDYFDENGMQYAEDVLRVYEGSEIQDGFGLDDAYAVLEMTEPNLTEEEIAELLG